MSGQAYEWMNPVDEADVFLERRSVHDLHRNTLVAVFLRKLEYVITALYEV